MKLKHTQAASLKDDAAVDRAQAAKVKCMGILEAGEAAETEEDKQAVIDEIVDLIEEIDALEKEYGGSITFPTMQ